MSANNSGGDIFDIAEDGTKSAFLNLHNIPLIGEKGWLTVSIHVVPEDSAKPTTSRPRHG